MEHQLKVKIMANEIHFYHQEIKKPSLIEEVLEKSQQHFLEAALTYLEPESQDLQHYWNGFREIQTEEDYQSLWYYYHFGRILDSRSRFHLPLFPLSIGGPFSVVVGSGMHTSVSSLEFVVSLVHEDFLCSQRSSRVVVLRFRMGVGFPFLSSLSSRVVSFK